MLARIEFVWRWLGTAFSYVMFGFGGLMITVVVVPAVYCLPGGGAVARAACSGVYTA